MGGRPCLSHILRYIPSDETGTKLYCLVTEAHVCEQLAQVRYLAVHWAGVKPATSRLQARHAEKIVMGKYCTLKVYLNSNFTTFRVMLYNIS